MPNLTIVAHVTAKSNRIEFVKAELQKLVDITRTEQGCLQYDLHQDHENPAHFMFYENWASRELWQKHMNAPHLLAYRTACADAIDAFALNEMTLVA